MIFLEVRLSIAQCRVYSEVVKASELMLAEAVIAGRIAAAKAQVEAEAVRVTQQRLESAAREAEQNRKREIRRARRALAKGHKPAANHPWRQYRRKVAV